MAKTRLPSEPGDVWEGGFFFESPRDVRGVEARSGLVIAGGTDLYLLRAGNERMLTRPTPEDIGAVHAVAVEPRGQRRYAVASAEMIALFFTNKQGDQLLRLRPAPPGPVATHIAWGGTSGPCALYIRRDDGEILRMKSDLSDIEPLSLPPMCALASDDAGTVAMISFEPEPRVFVTRDGVELHCRAFEPDTEPVTSLDEDVYLAVAGTAVAFASNREGAFLSRGPDEPFSRCDPLETAGPLAFEGPSSDAALFGAIEERGVGAIVRVDREGKATRISEYGNDAGAAPAVTCLSWDTSRRVLWAASPGVGLLQSVAPGAKRGKKVFLS